MRLQHLGINVHNPDTFTHFLTTHFGLKPTIRNDRITMLEDEHGFVLALAAAPQPPVYPPDFHIGFYVTEAELYAAHASLIRHDFAPTPIALMQGSLKFFVYAPEEILIEVSVPGQVQTYP